MALTKYKLGDLIQESFRKNDALAYDISYVRGISNNKQITKTKADVDESVIHKFYIVNPGEFVYNPRTTRMGDKVGLGYNDTKTPLLFSFNNIAFFIKDEAKDLLLPEYLYMYYNRNEFDRYAMINGWGSATELFGMDEMCDIDIELPPLPVQQKYVDIYKAMLANQQSYERGIEDLRIVFEGYLDKLRNSFKHETIGNYIEICEDKNDELQYGLDSVRGISIEKRLIDTKADMTGVNLKPYYLLRPNEFVYVTVTSRNGEKISLAINDSENTYICSSSYVVFRCKDTNSLLPQYLMLYFSRAEFNRYARFNSWGSARETFDWNEMCEVKIPIPNIESQKAIANIYSCYVEKKAIGEKLKKQIKDICPVLIKGSIEEARKEA